MVHRRHPSLRAASLVAVASVCARAAAADPAADLFDKGVAQMEAGHYDQACPSISESQRLDPRPGTLFALAECEAKWGHPASALAHYDAYLSLYETLPPAKRAQQGNRKADSLAQKARLRAEVAELLLTLPANAPPGTRVDVDGGLLPAPALGVSTPVDPGAHVVKTMTPGGAESRLTVTLARGEKKQIVLDVPTSAGAVPGPTGPSGPSGRRVGAYVAGGVGVVGLVIGAVAGGLALAKKGAISASCVDAGSGVERCTTAAGIAAGNSAKTLGLASTVGWVTAGAGLGLGLALFLTEPPLQRPALGQANRKPLPGRRVSAGVLAASAAGSVLGVEGTW